MDQLTSTLDLYLAKKAPKLPANIRELLVAIAPWITLISLVIAIPGLLVAFGLSTFAMPMMGYYAPGYGASIGVAMLFLVVSLVLEAMAVPGLFSRSKSAWKLLYYAALVNAVYTLLSGGIVSMIIGALISLYILFQIRTYYK